MIGEKPSRNFQWSDAAGNMTMYALQFLGKVSGLLEADYTTKLGGVFVPTGGIIIWSGAVSAIPENWQICDGTNGTPNLTGRFVIHASADSGDTYDVGDTGGAASVTLAVSEMPAHGHDVSATLTPNRPNSGGFNGLTTLQNGSTGNNDAVTSNTGGGQAHENRPPYYALAYIMRVS